MLFWILASAITLITLAALYFASGVRSSTTPTTDRGAAISAHFKAQFDEIADDEENGLLSPVDAEGARAELAREMIRLKTEAGDTGKTPDAASGGVFIAAALTIAVLSSGIYAIFGNPHMSSVPLATREMPQPEQFDVSEAVATVEALLRDNPDDARGWSVIAPIYMQMGRFEEAAAAFRRILELLPPTADAETNLAEAIMMASNGQAEGEPMALLESAAKRDPNHIRSRFYLAGEATRVGDFENAISQWQALLAIGTGDEPWAEVARDGIRAAQAGLRGEPVPAPNAGAETGDGGQGELIRNMVEGLSERLFDSGGTIEEWTRLVRSRIVLGEKDQAQVAYDAAKAAYPEPSDRVELDAVAQDGGLE